MKKTLIIAALAVLPFAAPMVSGETKLESENAKIGYSLGAQYGGGLSKDLSSLDVEAFVQGFKDAFEKKPLQLSTDEMRQAIAVMQQNLQKQAQAASAQNKEMGEAFLAENAKKEGVVTLESGLQYKVIEAGSGPKPSNTSKVKVHYHGTLIDGTVFDSTIQSGKPAEFPVNQVIPGWTEALQLMPVGAKWRLFIPSDLAYGPRDVSAQIRANSTLIFDVELLEIL